MFYITTSSQRHRHKAVALKVITENTHTHVRSHTQTGVREPTMTATLWMHATFFLVISLQPCFTPASPPPSTPQWGYMSDALPAPHTLILPGCLQGCARQAPRSALPPSSAPLSPRLTVMNERERERKGGDGGGAEGREGCWEDRKGLGWGCNKSVWGQIEREREKERCHWNRMNGTAWKSHSQNMRPGSVFASPGGAVGCRRSLESNPRTQGNKR